MLPSVMDSINSIKINVENVYINSPTKAGHAVFYTIPMESYQQMTRPDDCHCISMKRRWQHIQPIRTILSRLPYCYYECVFLVRTRGAISSSIRRQAAASPTLRSHCVSKALARSTRLN